MSGKPSTLSPHVAAVARYCKPLGIDPAGSLHEAAHARQAVYVMSSLKGMSGPLIGKMFGVDHSTVYTGVKAVRSRLMNPKTKAAEVKRINAIARDLRAHGIATGLPG